MNRPLSHRARWALIVLIGYWVLLFSLTHIPMNTTADLPKQSDKVAHLLAYGGLGFLLAAAVVRLTPQPLAVYVILFAITLGYAAVDEVSQQLVPGRVADTKDWIADGLGSLIGLVCFRLLQPFARPARVRVQEAS